MRKFFVVVIAMSLLLSSCSRALETSAEIVKIRVTFDDSGRFCRGVICDGGTVLTVAHVFPDSYETPYVCEVENMRGETYLSELIYVDFSVDLALICYENESKPTVLSDGGRAFHIENGTYSLRANGRTISARVPKKPRILLELSARISAGDSGSAVTDEKGNLAGLICGRSGDGEYAYAVTAKTIEEFLSSYAALSDSSGATSE